MPENHIVRSEELLKIGKWVKYSAIATEIISSAIIKEQSDIRRQKVARNIFKPLCLCANHRFLVLIVYFLKILNVPFEAICIMLDAL